MVLRPGRPKQYPIKWSAPFPVIKVVWVSSKLFNEQTFSVHMWYYDESPISIKIQWIHKTHYMNYFSFQLIFDCDMISTVSHNKDCGTHVTNYNLVLGSNPSPSLRSMNQRCLYVAPYCYWCRAAHWIWLLFLFLAFFGLPVFFTNIASPL